MTISLKPIKKPANKTVAFARKIIMIIIAAIVIIVGTVLHAMVLNTILAQIEQHQYPAPCQYVEVYSNKNIHTCVYGSGQKIIVILPGLGTPSPAVDFGPLAKILGNQHRVVVIEPFGYGWSDGIGTERSSANIVNESRVALQKLGLTGPYILMAHSVSGLYDIAWQKTYPGEVVALIGLDTSVPAQINQAGINQQFNSYLIPLIARTGAFRVYYSLFPDRELSNYYTPQEKKQELAKYSSTYLNRTVINEQNKFYDNLYELKDYKYPYKLPVINLLSNESAQEPGMNWLDMHQQLVTNGNIQQNITLRGGHYIHHANSSEITRLIDDFINKNL